MALNVWDEEQVHRAKTTWGHKFPNYIMSMYEFAVTHGKSYLDLGCGFGRFLQYLTSVIEEPNYIGYDSSQDMLNELIDTFPHYSSRVFHRNITNPILNEQDVILCGAVLIHLPLEDQNVILSNIRDVSPSAIVFDINTPNEDVIQRRGSYERHIKLGCCSTFRMTWQSHYDMTKQVVSLFDDYLLTMEFYRLNKTQRKVVYKLVRNG